MRFPFGKIPGAGTGGTETWTPTMDCRRLFNRLPHFCAMGFDTFVQRVWSLLYTRFWPLLYTRFWPLLYTCFFENLYHCIWPQMHTKRWRNHQKGPGFVPRVWHNLYNGFRLLLYQGFWPFLYLGFWLFCTAVWATCVQRHWRNFVHQLGGLVYGGVVSFCTSIGEPL